jgi:phosphoglycerate kinase
MILQFYYFDLVLLASHCGRPKGQVNEKLSLVPMARRLGALLKKDVNVVGDCIGPVVDEAVAKLKSGDILMLENARFYKDEEKNVPEFAQKLAKNATIFVNDAFGTAHRAHASTEGVCHYVDHKVSGFLLDKEIQFLKGAVDKPVRPFAAIVGGKINSLTPTLNCTCLNIISSYVRTYFF